MEKERECAFCGNIFHKKQNISARAWQERYRYCSVSCSKRGKPSWNKGRTRTWQSPGSFPKGHVPWNKGKSRDEMKNEKNPLWKESGASMVALHNWVARRKGRPKYCEQCGLNDPNRMYHWSNISGEYRRDVDDYQRLCVPCHKRFDLSRTSATKS